MSKFFIHRPIFAIVISIIIVICGVLSAFQLPVAQYPQISPPTVRVSTTYVGASANVVNETVAQVIEQQVNGTQGMDYMTSNSTDTGYYSLQVVFKLGTNGDMDSVKVQNNVAVANASLPDSVKTIGVTTRKASNSMSMMLAFFSPNGTYDRTFIKNYCDINLIDQVKRVEGVGDVQAWGEDYSIRLWLNPDKLAELGLTVSDVVAAINEQNVQAPAGRVGGLPAPGNQEKQLTGKIDGRLVTLKEFGNIIIKTGNDGQLTRLKEVARIEHGPKGYDIIAGCGGKEAVGFGIQLTDDANTMVTNAEVRKVIENAALSFPPDLTYKQIMDSTDYIRTSVNEVVHTFIEALLLVVLVVFIFLQNARSTLIPLLAVPVSLIGTFASFIILDFSINTLTLFAMVLAIGLVVDDAIIVIENVEHHMATGLNPVDATERAMDEVQGPVVAIAFVLAAVFIPVAFLGGMMGVLYRQFALTIAISMALSAFVALTLTPALCATILKPIDPNATMGAMDKFFAKFNRGFDIFRNWYKNRITFMVNHYMIAVVVIMIVMGVTAFLYKTMPSTFVPDEDQGFYAVSVTLPEGTSLNQTAKTVDKLQNALQQLPGVDTVMNVSGFDVLSFGAKPNAGTMFVGLKDWSQRTTRDKEITSLVGATFGIGAKVAPEAQVIAFNLPALPGLGTIGGWSMQLQNLGGATDEQMNEVVKKIIVEANQRPELQGVRTSYRLTSPMVKYDIDREKVKELGVQLSDVFTAMSVNYGGSQVNDFNEFGRTYKVVLQSDKDYRSATNDMRFMFVRNSKGAMVPLDTLLIPKESTSANVVHRFNAAKAAEIQGNVRDGYSSGQAIAVMEDLVKEIAPDGYAVEWSGQSRQEKQSGSSTLAVLAMALVFVFLCLAALYESWSVPFAVLLSIPVGICGALAFEYGGMMITAMMGHPNPGFQNSVYTQIGIIMIIGLAAKNAILIVEWAKVRVDTGMNLVRATVEAAELRLRPIIMTSLAFIIGCLPLANATGAGAAARNGMGVAVVGGMLFATCISIFLIPSFYVITEIISEKLGIRKKASKKRAEEFM